MSKAAISGDFANYRPVLSRKVLQLVIEVPIESQGEVFEVLGYPIGGGSVPVAIARLHGVEERPAPPKPSPAVRDAAIVCREPEFWHYLEKVRSCPCDSEKEAATYVRAWCGVKSRADITPGSLAERAWSRLFLDYCSKREKAHG